MSGTLILILCCLASICLVGCGIGLTSSKNSNDKIIVCYFTNWAQYRPNEGKFVPEDIDPQLCTHFIFAYGWIDNHELSSYDSDDESQNGRKGMFERLVEIKNKNKDAKVLLAVGGWTIGTQRFKDMASNEFNRQLFVSSAVKYLRDRNFDGIDIDWEFPRGAGDRKHFGLLLKQLREAFEAEAKEKNIPRLLLTVDVSPRYEIVRNGYDVPALAENCDFINIMSYDFNGYWELQTGHNSPLNALPTASRWRKHLCVEFAVKLWEKLGAPKKKIIVGLASFGRSFTLNKLDKNGMNAPNRGGGKSGIFTGEEGFLSYYEVCDFIKKGAKYIWDDKQKVPYAVLGDQWVGFEDEKSIRIKLKWIKENGYGGANIWTLDFDDFHGTCLNGTKNPLIGAMGEELLGHQKRAVTNLEALSEMIIESQTPKPAPLLSKKVETETNSPKSDYL